MSMGACLAASAAVSTSTHISTVPCGLLHLLDHSARRSSGLRGKRGTRFCRWPGARLVATPASAGAAALAAAAAAAGAAADDGDVLGVARVGVVAVGLAPLLTAPRKLRKMDLPSTLRVME